MEEDNKIWIEVFSQGDVWELTINGKKLIATPGSDASDYDADELIDNGVGDLEIRAKQLGLELVKEVD